MTTLTYIPNIHCYRVNNDSLALHIDQIVQMYPSVLVDFLDCTYNNALDIQKTLKDERPEQIHIIDDHVYYLYK